MYIISCHTDASIVWQLVMYMLALFAQASNGTRTHDPFITSEVLYQLSYRSVFVLLTLNALIGSAFVSQYYLYYHIGRFFASII